MISIAFDQISADFFQRKEKTYTMCRNMAVIYNLKLNDKFLVVVILQKTQKISTNIPRYCRLVCSVGYCMMVKIRGYHDVGQSSLHLAKLTRLERFSAVSGSLKCSLVWS